MKVDPGGLIDTILNAIPYPVGKNNLIDMARQRRAGDQVIDVLERLPDKTFKSAQEVRDALRNVGPFK